MKYLIKIITMTAFNLFEKNWVWDENLIWNATFLDEFEAFPEGTHEDIFEAACKACSRLVEYGLLSGDILESFL
jgi:phage terminase large subunit-like protein